MILNKTLSTPQRLAKARNRRIDQEYGNNSFNIHELFQCQLQDHTGTTPVPRWYHTSTTSARKRYLTHAT